MPRGSGFCAGALIAWLSLGACGGSGGSNPQLPPAAMCADSPVSATAPSSVASISENVDTTCAAVVGFETWGMAATGSTCANPLDCTPVCCPCPNGTHHTLAAWCDQGHCAAPADVACMVAGTNLSACSN